VRVNGNGSAPATLLEALGSEEKVVEAIKSAFDATEIGDEADAT
jgi:hypothetical protein